MSVGQRHDLNLTLKNLLILFLACDHRGNKVTEMAVSQKLYPPSNLQASGEEPVYRLCWMDGLFIGLYLPACGVLRGTEGGWGRVIVWREGHIGGGEGCFALASVSAESVLQASLSEPVRGMQEAAKSVVLHLQNCTQI